MANDYITAQPAHVEGNLEVEGIASRGAPHRPWTAHATTTCPPLHAVRVFSGSTRVPCWGKNAHKLFQGLSEEATLAREGMWESFGGTVEAEVG